MKRRKSHLKLKSRENYFVGYPIVAWCVCCVCAAQRFLTNTSLSVKQEKNVTNAEFLQICKLLWKFQKSQQKSSRTFHRVNRIDADNQLDDSKFQNAGNIEMIVEVNVEALLISKGKHLAKNTETKLTLDHRCQNLQLLSINDLSGENCCLFKHYSKQKVREFQQLPIRNIGSCPPSEWWAGKKTSEVNNNKWRTVTYWTWLTDVLDVSVHTD